MGVENNYRFVCDYSCMCSAPSLVEYSSDVCVCGKEKVFNCVFGVFSVYVLERGSSRNFVPTSIKYFRHSSDVRRIALEVIAGISILPLENMQKEDCRRMHFDHYFYKI